MLLAIKWCVGCPYFQNPDLDFWNCRFVDVHIVEILVYIYIYIYMTLAREPKQGFLSYLGESFPTVTQSGLESPCSLLEEDS